MRSTILRVFLAIATASTGGACGDDGGFELPPVPPPRDAGRDAARDASFDASRDAGNDASPDAARPDVGVPDASTWEDSVLYFLLTDRFENGDPTNDAQDDDCFDPSSPTRFHGGDLAGLRARLPYLEELGADAVWITPVQAQIGRRGDQCGYHGYWANLDDPLSPAHAAIEPRLGDDAAMDALIEAMHARGMKLVVDLVVNHVGYDARLTRTRPAWFHPRSGCEALGPSEIYCALAGLPDLAHERADVRAWLDDYSAAFTRRFAFDGIRMDTVKHVPASYFADHWIPTVRAERENLWLVGELLDEGSYDPFEPYVATGFDGLFDFPLRRALIESLGKGGSLDDVAVRVQEYVNRFGQVAARRKSQLLDNHDVPRFLTESEGQPEALRSARYHLALALLFTVPGIPQLYMGNELGMTGRYPDNRATLPRWAFDAASRRGPHEGVVGDAFDHFALVQTLARTRREVVALRRGDYAELWRPNRTSRNVYAFARFVGDEVAVVAVNAGDEAVNELSMPWQSNPGVPGTSAAALSGALRERIGAWAGGSARVEGGRLVVSLPPRSAHVWTR
ncbi:MAG: glycosidase [Sandaracinus sp.]|nr:glycosidase [Sandaracinus sp.]MCB9621155.1 glycosidase [Sandaracinus sp.]